MRNHRYEEGGCRRGLTRVEVVIVVAALAFLLLGLLVPILTQPRCVCFRYTCGSNLAGIGKAMMLYANDYDGSLPHGGAIDSTWGTVPQWAATTRDLAYGLNNAHRGGQFSITSCFYLLVKYAEVTPKSFLCKGDLGATEFTLSSDRLPSGSMPVTELYQLWDFGKTPQSHCSYAYQAPWGSSALTKTGEPGTPVAADRNPWQPGVKIKAKSFPTSSDGKHTFQGNAGAANDQAYGNATVHAGDYQNVLFLDSHVSSEKWSYCGLDDDNIYTVSTVPDKGDPLGIAPKPTVAGATPRNRRDSVLVHDPVSWPSPKR
jgi:hypothetical protein